MTSFTQEDFDMLQAMLMHDNVEFVYEALDYLQAMNPPIELWWALLDMAVVESFDEWVEWLSQEEDICLHHRILAMTRYILI